jgi:precorrin-4/cobalt-precorrin-4 C11-methyltransferase
MTRRDCWTPQQTVQRIQGLHLVPFTSQILAVMALAICSVAAAAPSCRALATADQPLLIVRDLAGTNHTLSAEQFADLPQVSRKTKLPHGGGEVEFRGALLRDLLAKFGVRPSSNAGEPLEFSRPLRSAYVLIEAADGYQVVFSLPEIFQLGAGQEVLVAQQEDGQPLAAEAAPYRIVLPGSDNCERWVRMVRRVLVQPASAARWTSSTEDSQQGAPEDPPKDKVEAGVYLVGTGPGDPELIAIKAARVLRQAELVLCFHWMPDELAPFVSRDVIEVVSPRLQGGRYLGRPIDQLTTDQRQHAQQAHQEFEQLKARIKQLVAAGKVVVFADNGDPMIFSPWAWLPEQMQGVGLQVIPGMSSFNAGNAALKRGVASLGSVTLSSGAEIGAPDENGRLAGTIVFFTHRQKFQQLLPRLLDTYPSDTPVALVCDVSYPTEQIIQGSLGNILQQVADKSLPHLYLFYVGDGLQAGAQCQP